MTADIPPSSPASPTSTATTATTTAAAKRAGLLAPLLSGRVWLLVLLGFASGLPLALVGHTLSAWMTDRNVDLTTVGLFSGVMLPYSIKFLWAPPLDHLEPPVLGRRRGFAVFFQILLVGGLLWMSFIDPVLDAGALALAALCVAAFSASQDIVLDAYRTDILTPSERAAGTATFVTGYRLGMLASGSLALILADHMDWSIVYRVMAGFVGLGIITMILAKEPTTTTKRPPFSMQALVVAPLRHFTSREGAIFAFLFMLSFKIGDAFAGALTTRFFKEMGFTNTELGTLHSGVGMLATIAGGLIAGVVMPRVGTRKGLILFGSLQALTNIFFAIMAVVGKSTSLLVAGVILDNVAGGMGTAAFVAFLMGLCDKRYSATQYALFSSVSAFPARVMGAL